MKILKMTRFMLLWAGWGLILFTPGYGYAARVAGEDQPISTVEIKKDAPSVPTSAGKAADLKAPSPTGASPQAVSQERQAQPVLVPLPDEETPVTPKPLPFTPKKKPVPARLNQPMVSGAPPVTLPAVPNGVPAAERTAEPSAPVSKTPLPQATPVKETRYVTIDFDNVDIQVFVKFVSELTGKNFIIDEKVKGKVTVISPKKIALDEVYKVFESVLEINGFATVAAGDVIKIIPAVDARGKHVETLLKKDAAVMEDRIVTQIISLEHANADEMKKVLDPLISRTSVIIAYAPTGMLIISDVLSNIKKLREIVAALDVEGVGSQISYIPLKNASATDAVKSLTAIFQQQKGVSQIRFVADDRTNSLVLMASEADTAHVKELIKLMDKEIPKSGTLLHVYRLQNATAEDLAKVLTNLPKETSKDAAAQKGKSPVLSKDISIIPDKATNTLVITAERADYLILEDVIKKLDVPRPMVFIEALIMEVSVNKDFTLGVEWRGLKETGSVSGIDGSGSAAFIGSGSTTSSIIPSTTLSTTASSLSFPSGFSLGILGAGIKIGGVLFPNIGAVLQAYQSDQDVSILSTPQLLTIDNEEAEINVGENRPYLTRKESSTVTSTTDYSTYEYKDVGVILKLTSHINDESFIRLKVDQQVTRVVSASDSTLPVTRKRTAKTTVVVKDGETVVIGGLVGDTTEVNTYRVPCLGSIPLIGWLFKTMERNKEKTNLFVFITPRIIKSPQDIAKISENKKEGIGEIQDGVIKMYDKKKAKKEINKEE